MSSVDDLIRAAKELIQELEKQIKNTRLQSVSELPPVDAAIAKKIMTGISIEDAFHFHKGVNRPLWISASSLTDLYKKIMAVDLKAVEFHFQRGDFELWVRHLGDTVLADKIRELRQTELAGEMLRDKLYTLIKYRCDEMRKRIAEF
jgi:hypothetical protein